MLYFNTNVGATLGAGVRRRAGLREDDADHGGGQTREGQASGEGQGCGEGKAGVG